LEDHFALLEKVVIGGNVCSNIIMGSILNDYGLRLVKPSDIEKAIKYGDFDIGEYSMDTALQITNNDEGMPVWASKVIDDIKKNGNIEFPVIVPLSDLELCSGQDLFFKLINEDYIEETKLFREILPDRIEQYSDRNCAVCIREHSNKNNVWVFYTNIDTSPIYWNTKKVTRYNDYRIIKQEPKTPHRILVTHL